MLTTWLLFVGASLAGDEPAWKRTGLGFGGIPAVNFNSDEGLGLGAVGSIYKYDGATSPYKWSVTAILFATTRGVHGHRVDVDALDLAGGILRFTGRVNLDITKTNNFCGFGRSVTCDPAVAEAEAERRELTGEAGEEFTRRYFLASYVRPNLFLNGRWRLSAPDASLKTELMTSYRAVYHLPGNFKARDTDPGNLYSGRLGDEQGFLSVIQLGIMADTRDFESAPTRGIWTEASVRGAHTVTGSQFDYFGFNTTFRGYVPVVPRVVLASRVAVDGLVGDVPIREMAQMGGAQIYNFGGGLNAGRGVRQRRYLGRLKGLVQPEVRWTFLRFDPFTPIDLTLVGFSDLLFVAERWSDLSEFATPVVSEGAGLRIAFDGNFIIRVDTGFSAVEGFSPSIYIDLNNLY